MALKLGEVHYEDTRSFFMESSRPTGTPSLCTGCWKAEEGGGADLACCKPSYLHTKDSSAHLKFNGASPTATK